MIVVEGPDGSGKTTFIKQLVQDLKLPIAPRAVSSDAEALTDLVKWTEENLAKGFQKKIFDRHRLVSEMIYGPLLREHPSEGFDNYYWLVAQQALFFHIKPLIIVCLPPLEIVRENIGKDRFNSRLFPNKKQVDQLYWLYFNWAAGHPRVIKYDYTQEFNYPLVLNLIRKGLESV